MQLSEVDWRALAAAELGACCETALIVDGYFVLEKVFDAARVSAMHDDVVNLLEARFGDTTEANRGRNRYNIPLPARAPFVDAETVLNPLWFPLLQRVLGEDLVMDYLAADTPLQGSDYQAVHADAYPLFPGQHLSLPVCNVVVNILLTDFTWDNGSLEIWPNGSHNLDSAEADAGSLLVSPAQIRAPAGSVLVRDARMWHRGSPNRTPHLRPMLALAYQRGWFRFDVGHPPMEVGAETYGDWPVQLKKLFRFSHVTGGLNASVIFETFEARQSGFQKRPRVSGRT